MKKNKSTNITILNEPVSINSGTSNVYAKPIIRTDSLITFTRRLDWIIQQLSDKTLSTRFVEEDISYLKIKGHKKAYIAMKCFCDTSFSKLQNHIAWYGDYGLGFYKEWGLNNKLQPIQYINIQSHYYSDSNEIYNDLFNHRINDDTLKAYLISNLLYLKPFQGKAKKHNRKTAEEKCFEDENEWRYIPELNKIKQKPITINDNMPEIDSLNKVLLMDLDLGIHFEYKDIKYIIVKNSTDEQEIINKINNFQTSENEKDLLKSKIVVWDNVKGDI